MYLVFTKVFFFSTLNALRAKDFSEEASAEETPVD